MYTRFRKRPVTLTSTLTLTFYRNSNVKSKGYDLKIAYVLGDNLFEEMKHMREKGLPPHLDSDNSEVTVADHALDLLEKGDKPIVSANAYLGAREIVRGLEEGADIIIAGRVADASPVIGAAWYWHSWQDSDFNELAGALIAGHLIECSGYYPLDNLHDLTFGIAEVERDGTCVITKHDAKNGFEPEDTVKCQFLYELQCNVYLNSDVKTLLNDVQVKAEGKNRIRVWGIKGAPPPPTTKLAIFYRAGYQSEIVVNATGYATSEKFELWERIPEPDPKSQLRSTSYCRIFAEASDPSVNLGLASLLSEFAMQHYSGFHSTSDHLDLSSFGPITRARLEDVVLARSGDKGGNANIKEMFGDSWSGRFFIERVEFPKIYAVHFVIYGVLGRGVSGSSRLNSFAKGMGDWLRDVVVYVPERFIEGRQKRAKAGKYARNERNSAEMPKVLR
ncbi:DUF1446-domain-containing protein [Plenodomus tracheiphilus IPT5]|uniref:DUF1446-domain-containing protein n=1 Tax=Plenodomus tracheiphilus IPT5 TaxID=1408161 RepID=A0A6A7BFT2_9PLEO|nr:DUF1446-domain-containing protein [Plenodomus tracheiphilus IPT5]